MTTMKTSLANANLLPILRPVRASTPMISPFSTMQSILPDILPTYTSQKLRSKKHVRFALTLESVEEDPSLPSDGNSISPTTKPNKRLINHWREDGPLYGAYVQYLEKKDALTADIPEVKQPVPPPPAPEVESSIYTHRFLIQNQFPELVIDSTTASTPPAQLPYIVRRVATARKPNNNRKQSIPIIDSCIKQRIKTATPTRQIQSKKIYDSVNNKNHLHPAVKRVEPVSPSMKDLNSNERLIRAKPCLVSRPLNDYLQPKKMTEVITNPLPTANNQIQQLSQRSVLPNLPKRPSILRHSHTNNEPYFFQNHNYDYYQPIIHSTH